MAKYSMDRRMACWWGWYLILRTIEITRAENPFSGGVGGSGFLVDPFLELTAGVTIPANQKLSTQDPSCVSHGTLAGAIIGTLLLSAFIAFLTWMIYLRQKLQELHSYENEGRNHERILSKHHKQHVNNDSVECKENQLPLDVTDYKFGTFPFRQSQTPSGNGHYNQTDWLNRISSSFRSITVDKDTEMIDIELLNPTFCGLNFSITGNMRAGIFIKEILDKETSKGQIKLNSSDKLKTGDRIIALTVCFESIVYEDALTILSYASPYPVILRVQRPMRSTKVNVITEKRPPTTTTTTNKVKWRDDFEHYDNDTSHNRSADQLNSEATLIKDSKATTHHRTSSKKNRSNKSPTTNKGNKSKTPSHTVGAITKRSKIDIKKHRNKIAAELISTTTTTTGLSAKPIEKISTPQMTTNKTTMKSVTNAVISYLHYRGANGGHVTDVTNNSEATLMPYYDSPYDYYGANLSHSHLNKNNNNSLSTESLTAVTSIYTIQLSPSKPILSTQQSYVSRRCERRLSSPAGILSTTTHTIDEKDTSLQNIDTFV